MVVGTFRGVRLVQGRKGVLWEWGVSLGREQGSLGDMDPQGWDRQAGMGKGPLGRDWGSIADGDIQGCEAGMGQGPGGEEGGALGLGSVPGGGQGSPEEGLGVPWGGRWGVTNMPGTGAAAGAEPGQPSARGALAGGGPGAGGQGQPPRADLPPPLRPGGPRRHPRGHCLGLRQDAAGPARPHPRHPRGPPGVSRRGDGMGTCWGWGHGCAGGCSEGTWPCWGDARRSHSHTGGAVAVLGDARQL